jgi:hypothetical protein
VLRLAVEYEQGIEDVLLVIAVVVGAFLIAVGGVCGPSKSRSTYFGVPRVSRSLR